MTTSSNQEPEAKERKDIYEIVTNLIIAELEKGVVPWHKPWPDAGAPQNLLNRKPYRGINSILLGMLPYDQQYYLTFKQINAVGAKVRKGEKSHLIVFWNWKEVEDDHHEKKKLPFLRYYLVFNISQIEDLPKGLIPHEQVIERNNDIEAEGEAIYWDMPNHPDLTNQGSHAYYNSTEDCINIPPINTFDDAKSYYETLFHELVHSTAHPDRLGRTYPDMDYANERYSLEELVAEIGACFLKSHTGIWPEDVANNAAYIGGWLEVLKNDKKFIFQAASFAQKAVDYILGSGDKKQTELVTDEVEMF